MERLHIAFFGPTNSGKSTLVNALAGQQVSLVSPIPGTTTDPVRKVIELPGLGPCVLIDTAGLGDGSALGAERQRLTRAILDETDIAVILDAPEVFPVSQNIGHKAQNTGGSALCVPDFGTLATAAGIPVIRYTRGESVESLLQRLIEAAPREEQKFLTGGLVQAGSSVLLVMPQDSEAPKGRLILPQVQVLRELLDRGCVPHSCTPDSLQAALESLSRTPDLVITDSQVFGLVERSIPKDCPLTSFSVLLAAAKGDVRVFVEGANAIDALRPGDRVLIAEACTHVPDTEDIGRVKIPALLRKKAGEIEVDIAAGNDFPVDLSPYSLIVHCGACVANARLVRSRIRKALLAGVPITNYGIAIAKLQGILDRISIP
ncbi:MAG: [Bacteroidales bacterium]|nr:[FeFe] hydrogenase H-cluster maturation GTPase HydF [Bacteroidales bacterium]